MENTYQELFLQAEELFTKVSEKVRGKMMEEVADSSCEILDEMADFKLPFTDEVKALAALRKKVGEAMGRLDEMRVKYNGK